MFWDIYSPFFINLPINFFSIEKNNLNNIHYLSRKPSTEIFSMKKILSFGYYFLNIVFWRRGVVVITTAKLHSTKSQLRFCAGSNPACGVSEIRDGEDLWQWSRLEIRLHAFRRSIMPQKQFIIIIITTVTSVLGNLLLELRIIYKIPEGLT